MACLRKNSSVENIIKYFEAENLVNSIRARLEEYDGSLVFIKNKFPDDAQCDGEFSEDEMKITCIMTPSEYWIAVLIHEYCHFLQCINQKKVWLDFQDVAAEVDPEEIDFDGLGCGLNIKKRKKLVSEILKLESDCERMTLKMIREKNIKFKNLKEYIAKSNIIYYKYIYWAEHNFWPRLDLENLQKSLFDWRNFKCNSLVSLRSPHVSKIPEKLLSIFDESRSKRANQNKISKKTI